MYANKFFWRKDRVLFSNCTICFEKKHKEMKKIVLCVCWFLKVCRKVICTRKINFEIIHLFIQTLLLYVFLFNRSWWNKIGFFYPNDFSYFKWFYYWVHEFDGVVNWPHSSSISYQSLLQGRFLVNKYVYNSLSKIFTHFKDSV